MKSKSIYPSFFFTPLRITNVHGVAIHTDSALKWFSISLTITRGLQYTSIGIVTIELIGFSFDIVNKKIFLTNRYSQFV